MIGEQDAAIFHRYAEYLWRRAGGIVLRRAVTGALLGAALGAVMLTSWADWPLPRREVYLLIVLGAVAGGFLGRSSGTTRALGLRLQAQLAQHQLQFERHTLAQGHVRSEPAAQAPYVPTGAPPVSAKPVAAAGPAAVPESGTDAETPVAIAPPVVAATPVAAKEPVADELAQPPYGWQAIEPANT